ncbi:histidine phosphatase family protein [Pseudomonas helleri]|uniref:Histidine phosphatase family protein n=1 Tax=Pseudomonas helleri TaxID=1608996 RepID=A0A7X2BL46_9PSED|nr:histidine phosphatase family protein [Pseudomonas helleri]MQT50044.1 histidine phosphatase family protein [Pseudomonas helleri]MQT88185.1 histidine phosphatase family protein [Pseudomonas helleri]
MKLVRLIRHAESAANAGLVTTAPDSIPLTEKGQIQAQALAYSFTSAPDLIISSPFERAIATARPTADRFIDVPFELWPIEEFTYLSPNRFAGTTQADRKPYAENYWESGDAAMIDGPGAESFDHLLRRVDAMLAKLADHDAKNILVFSHGQFIRGAAWRIKHGSHARSYGRMHEFRALDVGEPFRNCRSYQFVFDDGSWAVECQIDSSSQERFIDEFCTR